MARTVISLFDDLTEARKAEHALVNAGFDREDLSLLTDNSGARYGVLKHGVDEAAPYTTLAARPTAEGPLTGMGQLSVTDLGQLAVNGPLARTLAASPPADPEALAGSLGLHGVPPVEARLYIEAVRRGGALLILGVRDPDTDRAVTLIDSYETVDLEARARRWLDAGWRPAPPADDHDAADSTPGAPAHPTPDETARRPARRSRVHAVADAPRERAQGEG